MLKRGLKHERLAGDELCSAERWVTWLKPLDPQRHGIAPILALCYAIVSKGALHFVRAA